ncbi:hypothetical protein MRB53_040553 [Persea americana]|nr:hypothetical protein MRB53_040553 [Persea americana]
MSKFWEELVVLIEVARPSLEYRSCSRNDDPSLVRPPESWSKVIILHHVTVLKDLQRLNNILSIARNVLTMGEDVQNLAHQMGFEGEIFRLINLCIKITARGYDGDPNHNDEEKWQGVINGCTLTNPTQAAFC